MKRKASRGWMIMSFALAVILVACQPAGSTAPSGGQVTPSGGQAKPASTPAAAAPAAAKPEGILRVGLSAWGDGLVDPPVARGMDRAQLVPLYDWLVGTKPDGSDISPDTGAATKWEQAADGSSWTFSLRKGIQFHDGYGELTADDVKFSLERTMFSPKSKADFVTSLKAAIDKIEVVDAYTVKFVMKKPNITLPYDLSAIAGAEGIIVSKKHIEKVGEDEFSRHPVGSGPYKFAQLAAGSYIKLEATDKHFAVGVPKYKEVYIQLVYEEATRIAMLKTGELDVIEATADRVGEIEKDFTVGEKAGSSVVLLYFIAQWQGNQGNMSDKRLRQAIDLAIDRETLLRTILKGRGSVISGFMYPSWSAGTKPMKAHPYDPDKARALLQEAGLSNIELDFPTSPQLSLLTEGVAGQLQKAGFKVKISPVDFSVIQAKYLQHSAVAANPPRNAIILSKGSNRVFPQPIFATMYRSNGAYALIEDPKADSLIDDLAKSKNIDEYTSRVGPIQEYLDQNLIALALFDVNDLYAGNPKKVSKWSAGGKVPYDPGLRELMSQRN